MATFIIKRFSRIEEKLFRNQYNAFLKRSALMNKSVNTNTTRGVYNGNPQSRHIDKFVANSGLAKGSTQIDKDVRAAQDRLIRQARVGKTNVDRVGAGNVRGLKFKKKVDLGGSVSNRSASDSLALNGNKDYRQQKLAEFKAKKQANSINTGASTSTGSSTNTGSTSTNTGATSMNTGATSTNTGSASTNTGSTSTNTGASTSTGSSTSTGATSMNTGATSMNTGASTSTGSSTNTGSTSTNTGSASTSTGATSTNTGATSTNTGATPKKKGMSTMAKVGWGTAGLAGLAAYGVHRGVKSALNNDYDD